MKKNSRLSRILTAFLALVLLLSAFAISALAQDTGKSVNAEIDTVYEGRGGIVTLTFDDGRTDTSTLVNELMKEYELTGTLMLIGKNVEKNMSLWNEIFQDGKLIPQNHSMNHIGMRPSMDTEVENITEENFQAEIVDSKVFFENIFPDYDMITYAIPNGSWADSAAEVAVGEYYMIRSSYGGLQSLNPGYLLNKNGNWSSIKCISIDTTKRPEQLTELKSQVDQATQGQWMCTLTHRVGDIDNTELTESEARELFAYISAYEKSGLLWVTDTVSATKYIRERQNTTVSATKSGKVITLSSAMAAKTEDGLTLDKNVFNHPLTVKVELDSSFENAFYTVGGAHKEAEVFTEGSKRYARVEIIPGGEDVVIYSDPADITYTTVTIADDSSKWSYLANDTDPAQDLVCKTEWTLIDFDDSAWTTASGRFGSKGGELAAINNCTPTVLLPLKADGASNNIRTYFFRYEFEIDSIDSIRALPISFNADDGAVVYLNGNVIFDTRTTKKTDTNLYYSSCSVYKDKTWLDPEQLQSYAVNGKNVFAVEVHNASASSSDIYFDLTASAIIGEPATVTSFSHVILNIGANEASRNFNWYTNKNASSEIQVAKRADMIGTSFPETYMSASATNGKADNSPTLYYNKASISDLEKDTEYVYRLKCGEKYSQIYSFNTGEYSTSYSFTVLGDPQLRGTRYASDTAVWNDTLEKVSTNFNPEFIITAGDQIDHVGDYEWELEYEIFINEYLKSIAVATTLGNHDYNSTAYSHHFNMPNLTNYAVAKNSSSYYFTYGGVLFMNLNFWGDVNENVAFMEWAIANHPECTWQVVVTHASLYSAGEHSDDTRVVEARPVLSEAMTELGIDVVFSGHDHIYTRSYLMDGTDVAENQSAHDAEGVLYICSGSTGSKFYDESKVDQTATYVAKTFYQAQRVAIDVSVTPNTFTITTYNIENMSVLDTYTLSHGATAGLATKTQEAENLLARAENKLEKAECNTLAALIEQAYELMESYTDESELDAMIEELGAEIERINNLLTSIDVWSKGAKQTIFDTAENVKVIHLNSNGAYTMSSPGAGQTFTLYQTVNEEQTEIASWTEGSAYARLSKNNPSVVFILDENVTFSGKSSWYATNIMFDLNGNDIRFTSSSSAPLNLKNGASVEFRGTGNIVWATTSYYMVQGDNFNGVLTLNGNVTVDTENTKARVIFYLKGGIYVYGTLTINDNFNATADKGAVFFTQGSRSSAKDVKGFVEIVDATITANNKGGAALFYAKGVSGEYGNATYESIPEFNVINSTLNIRCPLIAKAWCNDSVSGNYADTTDHELENAVNTAKFNLINSRVNADIYYETSFTDAETVSLIAPNGHTAITVSNSVITMTHGRIFLIRGNANVTINCNNSVLTTNFSDAEASAISSEMSKSTILRGTTVFMTKEAKGSAVFTDCTITTAYRMFEGANTDASLEAFFITATNCEMRHTAKSSVFAVRANVTVNGGMIDCGTGNLTYRTLPYNPDTKTGVLFTGGVILYNAPSSAYSSTNSTYAITVSAYAEKAKNDSAVYTTYGASHVVTIADGTKFTQINSKLTASGRYSFRLDVIGAENDTGLDPLCNVTLYTDFVIHVYVPVSETLTEIELDGVKYTDFDSLDIRIHEGTSYYKISKRVPLTYAAEKMSLKVTVTAEGEQITEAWTLSVVTHVKSLINSDDMSDATKTLAKDVLSYIRAAYEYASVCEADIERINAIIGTNYDSTSMPDTTISASESFPAINAATLELGSRPSFVFWVKEDYDATSFKFSVNGNNLDYEIFTDDDGNTCIRLSMYAFLMADTVTYTVDGADVQGEYNIKTYYEFAKKLNDDSLTNLVERLWKYAESARIYEKEVR